MGNRKNCKNYTDLSSLPEIIEGVFPSHFQREGADMADEGKQRKAKFENQKF